MSRTQRIEDSLLYVNEDGNLLVDVDGSGELLGASISGDTVYIYEYSWGYENLFPLFPNNLNTSRNIAIDSNGIAVQKAYGRWYKFAFQAETENANFYMEAVKPVYPLYVISIGSVIEKEASDENFETEIHSDHVIHKVPAEYFANLHHGLLVDREYEIAIYPKTVNVRVRSNE